MYRKESYHHITATEVKFRMCLSYKLTVTMGPSYVDESSLHTMVTYRHLF